MREVIYLTFEQVIVIHDNQIQNCGGKHGMRDLGLLESSIYRIRASFMGKDLYISIFDKAATLIHSLVLNHAFIDGNKRTALVSGLIFLELNGYRLTASNDDVFNQIINVVGKKTEVRLFSLWLKKNSKKI